MSIDDVVITKDTMCIMCREDVGAVERGVFPVLNMEQVRERREKILADYMARGVTGDQCRRCGMLPVVR